MSWSKVRLESVASKNAYSFVGGPFGSKLTSKDYVDEGVPVIRGGSLASGRYVCVDDFVYVSEHKVHEDLLSNLAYPGDLVFTQRGTLGQVAIVPENGLFDKYVISQSQMKITLDEAKVYPLFIYYYFTSRQAVGEIMSLVSTSGVPHINLSSLRSFLIPKPPLREQRYIADFLSCYDGLIENNQRRIQLLENSARLLYKEWFIHLRFPGHEHVNITNGVPEGWSRKRLFDVTLKIGSGATPKGGASAYQPEGIALIRSQNVYDYQFDSSGLAFINDEQADKLSNVEVNRADILLNITGASVGRCCLAPDYHLPARVNQHVMIIRADSRLCGPSYLLHFINSYREKQRILAAAGAGGSTREALTKSFVQNLEVTLPSRTILEQFEVFAKDCFEQKQKLEMQNIRLAKARDLLLPKLMSGELAA